MRVAVVITRLEGGAGVLALRGALAMDREAFELTIVTGSGDRLAGRRGGGRPGDHHRARPARADRPAQRPAGAAAADRPVRPPGLRCRAHALRQGRHGRPPGRAPRRGAPAGPHVPRFPVPRVPVGRPQAGLRVDRAAAGPVHRRGALRGLRRGRRSGAAAAGRTGTDPDHRRGRRRAGHARLGRGRPRRAGAPPRPDRAGPAHGRHGGGRGRPADLPEGARGLPRRHAAAGPAGGHRSMGRRWRAGRADRPPGPGAVRDPGPAGGRAHRRPGRASGLRRLRAAQPLRGPAHRRRRGDELRRAGGRLRGQRRLRRRAARRDGLAGTAAAARPDGQPRSGTCWTHRRQPPGWPRPPAAASRAGTPRRNCAMRSPPPTRPPARAGGYPEALRVSSP